MTDFVPLTEAAIPLEIPRKSDTRRTEMMDYVLTEAAIPLEIPRKSDKRCCIYRVPEKIRKINEEAYTPQLISIGPLHYGTEKLATWEKRKKKYKKSFLGRRNNMEAIVEKFLEFITREEKRIRKCYSEDSNLCSKQFVEMILHDAIFIIELFLRNRDRDHKSDLLLDVSVVKGTLSLDLRLLENQLPYFVLEEICKLDNDSPTLMELSHHFFRDESLFNIELLAVRGLEFEHLTDLARSILLKDFRKVESHELLIKSLPSAAQLQQSGVKFEVPNPANCLLDIRFEKRTLQIPHLKIFDETECLLRNMMALEQCHYREDNRVCAYVSLLDSLINKETDVELLVEKKIITSFIGDNASVANMFNRLCLHHRIDKAIYSKTIDNLNTHYNKPLNRTMATLRNVYFTDLWRGTATVAAIILLLLTFIQTICSIKQVI